MKDIIEITTCPYCDENQVFKSGQCIYNKRLGLVYTIDEIVEILNNITEVD